MNIDSKTRDPSASDGVPGTGAEKTKKSLGRMFFAWLCTALGLPQAAAFWRSPGRQMREGRRQLERNLALEKTADQADFARVLRLWGLDEKGMEDCVRAKLLEARAGLVLCLLSLGAFACSAYFGQAFRLLGILSLAASGSMALAGLLSFLACHWRARMLRTRRFVPFTRWLARLPFSFFTGAFFRDSRREAAGAGRRSGTGGREG